MRRLGWLAACLTAWGCGASDPCDTSYSRRVARTSLPYAGRWIVARGDTLTLPDGMGDRFRLAAVTLDTHRVATGRACRFTGSLVFTAPSAETLTVTWFGEPEQAVVFGWPAALGPFAGVALTWWGRDSLRGALLFDERLNVRLAAGVTAEFVAGRPAR